jgi:hypothetical protein
MIAGWLCITLHGVTAGWDTKGFTSVIRRQLSPALMGACVISVLSRARQRRPCQSVPPTAAQTVPGIDFAGPSGGSVPQRLSRAAAPLVGSGDRKYTRCSQGA